MSIKQLFLAAVLTTGFTASVHAADAVHHFDFKAAVDRAVADGTLDGSVKFYLKGNKSGGRVLEKEIVTNQKTNGFGKSAEKACDWVLRSALIQLDKAAKAR
ncbi:MAG: excinuclease, partial [Pseudomonadota bacterium]|nr:excinuclease [Pseudomonadota bacterium]